MSGRRISVRSMSTSPKNDAFEELLRQLRECHRSEMQLLREELLTVPPHSLAAAFDEPKEPREAQGPKEAEELKESKEPMEWKEPKEEGSEAHKANQAIENAEDMPLTLSHPMSVRSKSFQDAHNMDNQKGWEQGKSQHVGPMAKKQPPPQIPSSSRPA